MLAEERLQHLDQHLHIWTVDAKTVQDAALYVLNQPPLVPVYSLQPLTQAQLHGVQEMLLLSEQSCPHLGQKATYRLWLCSPLLSLGQCFLWGRWRRHERAMKAIFSKGEESSLCLSIGLW